MVTEFAQYLYELVDKFQKINQELMEIKNQIQKNMEEEYNKEIANIISLKESLKKELNEEKNKSSKELETERLDHENTKKKIRYVYAEFE